MNANTILQRKIEVVKDVAYYIEEHFANYKLELSTIHSTEYDKNMMNYCMFIFHYINKGSDPGIFAW